MVFLAACIIVFFFGLWLVGAIAAPLLQAGAEASRQRAINVEFERWRDAFWRCHGRLPEERDWHAHQEWKHRVREIERALDDYSGIPDPTLERGYR